MNSALTFRNMPTGDQMDWVRGHMRAHITSPGSAKPAAEDILLKYRRPVIAAETRNGLPDGDDSPATLRLAYQLVEVLRSKEDHAAEIEARAQALAKRAIEELNLAETRIRSAEIARNAAEADRNEANARVEEFEGALKHMEARISTAENQLSVAVLRAKTAETRAAESEEALRLLEDAIRTHLLAARGQASSRSAAAA